MIEIEPITEQFNIKYNKAEKPSHAALSHVFILDKKYVLRSRELNENTIERFEKEIDLLDKARKLVPYKFPEPLKAKDGKRYIIHEGLFWTIHKILEGKIIGVWQKVEKITDSDREKLMRELRNMHDLTRGKFRKNEVDFNYFLEDVSFRYEEMKKVEGILSMKVMKRIDKAIENVKKTVKKYNTEEACFIHGDYHHANTLVDENGKVIGLLDLDWCRVSQALEDVSYTIMMYLRNYSMEKFQFDEKVFNNLIKWYGIDKTKLKIFYDYLILYILFDLQVFYNYPENANNKKFGFDYQLSYLNDMCTRL